MVSSTRTSLPGDRLGLVGGDDVDPERLLGGLWGQRLLGRLREHAVSCADFDLDVGFVQIVETFEAEVRPGLEVRLAVGASLDAPTTEDRFAAHALLHTVDLGVDGDDEGAPDRGAVDS